MKYLSRNRATILNLLYISIALTLLSSCSVFQMRMPDKEMKAYFHNRDLDVEIAYYKTKHRKMRYASIGNDSLPTVLLVHGAPSSMLDLHDIMTDNALLQKAKVYAVDRPGYGFSGFGKTETSIKRQAALIKPLLDSIRTSKSPVVVMGVSYGGPVAARLALDYPDLVDGLVLGAPAIAPGEERTYWITHLIKYPPLRWLMPEPFVVATDEKLAHREELEKMLPLWEHLRKPIIYVQGEDDNLIYTTNAAFLEKKAKRSPFLKILMIPGQPHFLAIPQKEVLVANIIEMIDMLKGGRLIAGDLPEKEANPKQSHN